MGNSNVKEDDKKIQNDKTIDNLLSELTAVEKKIKALKENDKISETLSLATVSESLQILKDKVDKCLVPGKQKSSLNGKIF